jgi:hypothetical protein
LGDNALNEMRRVVGVFVTPPIHLKLWPQDIQDIRVHYRRSQKKLQSLSCWTLIIQWTWLSAVITSAVNNEYRSTLPPIRSNLGDNALNEMRRVVGVFVTPPIQCTHSAWQKQCFKLCYFGDQMRSSLMSWMSCGHSLR